jgi:D-alanine-D-alanine ligase-like ATP-grasp enzyme
LQDISNLSAGGETIELTDKIHTSFVELSLLIARDMNLTLCGIDIITSDITQQNDGRYTVIEVNSAPGLDNYAYEGAEQETYVESLYKKVLLYIRNSYS